MKKMDTSRVIKQTAFYLSMIILVVGWLAPIFFIVITSLKGMNEFYSKSVFSLPAVIRWENFSDAWQLGHLSTYIKNSSIITVCKIPLSILLESITAFSLTRLKLKHSNLLFVFFLVGMMIPLQVLLVPLNIAITRLHLINTYLGIIIIYTATSMPFGILVMRGFFRTIPIAIDEAARIDGCSNLRLYWDVLFPIARPAVATLVILEFLATWNEFLFASLFITDNEMRTIPQGLLQFFGEQGAQYPLLSAGILLSVIPVALIYAFFQRYFVEGMAGAVKG